MKVKVVPVEITLEGRRTYMEVTRELVHMMPSQPSRHGSEPTFQLGGTVFFQASLRACRAAPIPSQKRQIKHHKTSQTQARTLV